MNTNTKSDAVGAFVPTIGRASRAFAHVWQVVRYETGYSAETLGIEVAGYVDDHYRMGRRDAQMDAYRRESNARRQKLDDMLMGACQ